VYVCVRDKERERETSLTKPNSKRERESKRELNQVCVCQISPPLSLARQYVFDLSKYMGSTMGTWARY
jgi:hypothetical protein